MTTLLSVILGLKIIYFGRSLVRIVWRPNHLEDPYKTGPSSTLRNRWVAVVRTLTRCIVKSFFSLPSSGGFGLKDTHRCRVPSDRDTYSSFPSCLTSCPLVFPGVPFLSARCHQGTLRGTSGSTLGVRQSLWLRSHPFMGRSLRLSRRLSSWKPKG